jgi:TonB family protein
VDRRKSGRIVIQTSPNAHVYLNGVFKGQARPQGRMVIEDVKPGFLALRVSLEGKQDYEQKVAVLAGQEVLVAAQLEDVVPPKEVVVPPKEVVVPPTGGVPEKANPTFSIETPTTLSDTRGVDFGPYLIRINNIVRRNWLSVIPEPARLGEKGRVGVVFEILKNGSAPQVRLVASSGSDPLDQAAVKGIQASVPFPPLPQEFTGNHLVLQFVFLYNLTTQSGGDF